VGVHGPLSCRSLRLQSRRRPAKGDCGKTSSAATSGYGRSCFEQGLSSTSEVGRVRLKIRAEGPCGRNAFPWSRKERHSVALEEE